MLLFCHTPDAQILFARKVALLVSPKTDRSEQLMSTTWTTHQLGAEAVSAWLANIDKLSALVGQRVSDLLNMPKEVVERIDVGVPLEVIRQRLLTPHLEKAWPGFLENLSKSGRHSEIVAALNALETPESAAEFAKSSIESDRVRSLVGGRLDTDMSFFWPVPETVQKLVERSRAALTGSDDEAERPNWVHLAVFRGLGYKTIELLAWIPGDALHTGTREAMSYSEVAFLSVGNEECREVWGIEVEEKILKGLVANVLVTSVPESDLGEFKSLVEESADSDGADG